MRTPQEIIFYEIATDHPEVRAEYLKLFADEAKSFAEAMATAHEAWSQLDKGVKGEDRAYVVGVARTAHWLLVESMTCFLTGHLVAAGNLFRQVLETIALALLCSEKDGPVLPQFMAGSYRSYRSIDEVIARAAFLGLKADALQQLKTSQQWYHKYSHPTQLTLGNQMSFSGDEVYVGCSFDPAKEPAYRKEMTTRLNLAKVFPNFIAAVEANMKQWTPITLPPNAQAA